MNTFSTQDEYFYRDLSHDDDVDETRMELSPIGVVVGFSVLSATFALISVFIIRCNWYCREFYEWNAIRLAMPGLCILLSIQNATLAFDYDREKTSSQFAIALYMISSVIAPGELSVMPYNE